jgi:hypothetical protein
MFYDGDIQEMGYWEMFEQVEAGANSKVVIQFASDASSVKLSPVLGSRYSIQGN